MNIITKALAAADTFTAAEKAVLALLLTFGAEINVVDFKNAGGDVNAAASLKRKGFLVVNKGARFAENTFELTDEGLGVAIIEAQPAEARALNFAFACRASGVSITGIKLAIMERFDLDGRTASRIVFRAM